MARAKAARGRKKAPKGGKKGGKRAPMPLGLMAALGGGQMPGAMAKRPKKAGY